MAIVEGLEVAKVTVLVAFRCGCLVERSAPGCPAHLSQLVQCTLHAAESNAAGTCQAVTDAAETAALDAGVRTVSNDPWIGDPPPAFAEMKAIDERLRNGS